MEGALRIDQLLPTVERAREAGVEVRVDEGILHHERSLLEEGPEETRKCLGLVVRALVVRRAVWSDRTEMSPRQVASALRTAPPVRRDFEQQAFVVLRELVTPEPGSCTYCSTSPGWAMCSVCGGEGVVYEQRGSGDQRRTVAVPCYGCGGDGTIRCGPCEGTGVTHRVVVDRGEDTVHGLEHAFLPALGGDLYSRVSAHLMAWDPLPEVLRFDLHAEERPDAGTPYRSAAPRAPQRWGHLLGNVAAEARRAIAVLGRGDLVHEASEAHTVPLLVLRYRRDATAVLAPGPGGSLVGFGHI